MRRPSCISMIRVLLAALVCSFVPSLISAQTYTGGVRGAVHDALGVVPAAEVTLVNAETNARRTTNTNEDGEYTFANVVPGTYALSVTMTGFATYENRGVRVATQQF